MSSAEQNLSTSINDDSLDLNKFNIAIVTAEWNKEITHALRDECLNRLLKYNAKKENIITIVVPGAFELPGAAKMLLSQKKMDAVICIGCVIKGETKHDEYISSAVAQGIMNLSILSGKPIIFGVLTTNDIQQAKDRAGGKHGNKGIEAAETCAYMLQLNQSIGNPKSSIGFNP
jgi:6,7-dimethyl-8-ribityllumazine synthase